MQRRCALVRVLEMILRDRSTQENRDYWDFIEKIAAEVREWPEWKQGTAQHFFCNIDGGGRCTRGNGTQTCVEFMAGTTPGTAIPYGR